MMHVHIDVLQIVHHWKVEHPVFPDEVNLVYSHEEVQHVCYGRVR